MDCPSDAETINKILSEYRNSFLCCDIERPLFDKFGIVAEPVYQLVHTSNCKVNDLTDDFFKPFGELAQSICIVTKTLKKMENDGYTIFNIDRKYFDIFGILDEPVYEWLQDYHRLYNGPDLDYIGYCNEIHGQDEDYVRQLNTRTRSYINVTEYFDICEIDFRHRVTSDSFDYINNTCADMKSLVPILEKHHMSLVVYKLNYWRLGADIVLKRVTVEALEKIIEPGNDSEFRCVDARNDAPQLVDFIKNIDNGIIQIFLVNNYKKIDIDY